MRKRNHTLFRGNGPNPMLIYPFLLMAIGVCLTVASHAQDVSIKHGGFFEGGHTDFSQGDSDTGGLYGVGTLYFQEVRHGALPHSQAAFLERASSVTVVAGDFVGNYPFIGKRGVDDRAIDLEYINTSHWVFGATYNSFEIDSLSETDTTALTLGRYLGDASRVLISLSDVNAKSVLSGEETDATLYGLEYKNVNVMIDGRALTLDMKYSHLDGDRGTSDEVSLSGEYHFSLATSVTGKVRNAWGISKGDGLAVGLNHYITPFLALGASYDREEPQGQPRSRTLSIFLRLLF